VARSSGAFPTIRGEV